MLSIFGSVTPWTPNTGVSTSTTFAVAKKERIRISRSARRRRVSRVAEGCQSGIARTPFPASVPNPALVFAGPGVDLDHFADIEEQRNLDHGASSQLGRL